MSFAQMTIFGYLGKDPSTFKLKENEDAVQFSVAVNRFKKREDGTKEPKVTWFKVIGFKKDVAFVMKNLKKGHRIIVMGDFDSSVAIVNNEVKENLTIYSKSIQLVEKGKDSDSIPTNLDHPNSDNLLKEEVATAA